LFGVSLISLALSTAGPIVDDTATCYIWSLFRNHRGIAQFEFRESGYSSRVQDCLYQVNADLSITSFMCSGPLAFFETVAFAIL